MEKWNHIKTFVFDIDGVFTDGQILITDSGEWLRSMNVKDGYAISKAVKAGYHIFVISGAKQIGMVTRLNYLGIKDVYHQVKDKVVKFKEHITANNIDPNLCLYMGDDIPDLALIKEVGMSTCPADAVEEIKSAVTYISSKDGGKGCVRDVIEKVMKLQGNW